MFRRTAICRGAILKAFLTNPDVALSDKMALHPANLLSVKYSTGSSSAIRIDSPIVRTSVGFLHQAHFIEGEHPQEDKFWSNREGIWLARDQMRW